MSFLEDDGMNIKFHPKPSRKLRAQSKDFLRQTSPEKFVQVAFAVLADLSDQVVSELLSAILLVCLQGLDRKVERVCRIM